MFRKTTTIALVALLALGALGVTGCRRVRIADEPNVTTESKTVPLEGAKDVDARVRMAVGELTISGETSTTNALDATFEYGPADWRPEVSFDVSDGTGRLEVRQPESVVRPNLRDAHNTWDLTLAGGVPTDLSLQLGVGRSVIDLSKVDVRRLDVLNGVGETTLDLTGVRTSDVDVKIEAGVGRLTIKLPKDVGVRVTGREDGIGDASADGFAIDGNAWINGAYGEPGPKIEVDLQRGVGEVNLLLGD